MGHIVGAPFGHIVGAPFGHIVGAPFMLALLAVILQKGQNEVLSDNQRLV